LTKGRRKARAEDSLAFSVWRLAGFSLDLRRELALPWLRFITCPDQRVERLLLAGFCSPRRAFAFAREGSASSTTFSIAPPIGDLLQAAAFCG